MNTTDCEDRLRMKVVHKLARRMVRETERGGSFPVKAWNRAILRSCQDRLSIREIALAWQLWELSEFGGTRSADIGCVLSKACAITCTLCVAVGSEGCE